MGDTEIMDDRVSALGREAVTLIEQRAIVPSSATPSELEARDALVKLASILQAELTTSADEQEQFRLCGRDAMETWLIGHASLLLGETSQQLRDGHRSHEDIARLLDTAIYGESERPKAFRRHLRSFYDEIDITDVRQSAVSANRPIDFVRVVLWVTLFLCHDYFAAIDEPSTAHEARALFDRLRSATDDFYARRRSAATRRVEGGTS